MYIPCWGVRRSRGGGTHSYHWEKLSQQSGCWWELGPAPPLGPGVRDQESQHPWGEGRSFVDLLAPPADNHFLQGGHQLCLWGGMSSCSVGIDFCISNRAWN